MLAPQACLAAAEIAFFSPAFCVAVFVLTKHGFTKQLGWIYLVLLSILRIIGASCTLYVDTQNDYSTSLVAAAVTTSAIGTAPLLLALMGFLERLNLGMEHRDIGTKIFRPIHIASLAALILSIIGGTDRFKTSASDRATGKDLIEAASVLFLVIYLSLAGITIWTLINIRWVLSGERKLIRACAAALPFLLVRIVYTVAVGFSPKDTPFYFTNVSVWARAFMQFLMEAIGVGIFVFAGLATPRMAKSGVQEDATEGAIVKSPTDLNSVNSNQEMECGRVPGTSSQHR